MEILEVTQYYTMKWVLPPAVPNEWTGQNDRLWNLLYFIGIFLSRPRRSVPWYGNSCSGRVHQYTSTPVHQYTSTQIHKYTSTPVHKYTSTPVHQYTSTQVHHYTSTPVHQYTITPVHQYTSTQVHQYTSTQVHQHTSTPAHQHTSTPVHIDVFQVIKKKYMLLSNFCISPFASCYVILLVLELKKLNLKGKCELALYLPCQWHLSMLGINNISKTINVEYCE